MDSRGFRRAALSFARHTTIRTIFPRADSSFSDERKSGRYRPVRTSMKHTRRGYSSAASSSSSSASPFFLVGVWYSSGTFSLQPLPETFKKAGLVPFWHSLYAASFSRNFSARRAFSQRAWCRLESPSCKCLAHPRSFVSLVFFGLRFNVYCVVLSLCFSGPIPTTKNDHVSVGS